MAQLYADITKIDKSKRVVSGYASTIRKDRDNQIIDPSFLRDRFPPWCDQYGNVRLMHQPLVVGKVVHRSDWDGYGYQVTAKVVDDDAWSKVEQGLLSGFSVGIKSPTVIPDPDASGGRLVDGEFIELSLVDIPANYDSDFVVVKSATFDSDTGSWLDEMDDDLNLDWMCDGLSDDDKGVYKRYYSDKERKDMDESDFAGPHRSFPIKTQEDVDNAARLIGHAKDPDEVKRRIIEIAHRKGLKIPDAWQKDTVDKTLDTSSGLQPYNLEGDKEANKTVTAEEMKAAMDDALRNVMDGMMTQFTEIRAKIEAMASQSDPDKDGDIDNTKSPEAMATDNNDGGEPVHAATQDAPNAVIEFEQDALKSAIVDEVTKTITAYIDEKLNTVTKSTVADNDGIKGLIAGVQKTLTDLDAEFKKTVDRLEVVEQSAAPAKGVAMVVEKFTSADNGQPADESAKIAEIVKTVRANSRGLSPALLQERIDQAIAQYKGGQK